MIAEVSRFQQTGDAERTLIAKVEEESLLAEDMLSLTSDIEAEDQKRAFLIDAVIGEFEPQFDYGVSDPGGEEEGGPI